MAKVKGSQLPVVSEIDGTEKMFAIKGGQNVMVPTSLLNGDSNILLPNGVVVVGTMEAVALGTRFENWVWRNNQVVIEQAATQTINIPNTAEGYRVDMIIGNQAGVIQRIAGEVAGAFPVPTNNQTLITYLLVGVSGFQTLDPAAQGFVTKSSFGVNPVLGENNVILKRGARVHYEMTNANSIIGFQSINDAPDNDANYPGQVLYLYNNQDKSCLLKHNHPSAPVPFHLPNSEDYYLQPYSGVSVKRLSSSGPYVVISTSFSRYKSKLFTPTWSPLTGQTGLVTMGNITFEANFFPPRCFVRFTALYKNINVTNTTKSISASWSTGKIFHNFVYMGTTDSSNSLRLVRNFEILNGEFIATATSNTLHDYQNSMPVQAGQSDKPNRYPFNVDTTNTLNFIGNLTNATDTLEVLSVLIEVIW